MQKVSSSSAAKASQSPVSPLTVSTVTLEVTDEVACLDYRALRTQQACKFHHEPLFIRGYQGDTDEEREAVGSFFVKYFCHVTLLSRLRDQRDNDPLPPVEWIKDYHNFFNWVTTTFETWLNDSNLALAAYEKRKEHLKAERDDLEKKEAEVKSRKEALTRQCDDHQEQFDELYYRKGVLYDKYEEPLADKDDLEKNIHEVRQQLGECDSEKLYQSDMSDRLRQERKILMGRNKG
ncbi:hypothetical protein IL306_001355 [Fusarium sp. DS 682]|nr:hypothetical protein IL306_001355 [Fusarium sp. DS 682]